MMLKIVCVLFLVSLVFFEMLGIGDHGEEGEHNDTYIETYIHPIRTHIHTS